MQGHGLITVTFRIGDLPSSEVLKFYHLVTRAECEKVVLEDLLFWGDCLGSVRGNTCKS